MRAHPPRAVRARDSGQEQRDVLAAQLCRVLAVIVAAAQRARQLTDRRDGSSRAASVHHRRLLARELLGQLAQPRLADLREVDAEGLRLAEHAHVPPVLAPLRVGVGERQAQPVLGPRDEQPHRLRAQPAGIEVHDRARFAVAEHGDEATQIGDAGAAMSADRHRQADQELRVQRVRQRAKIDVARRGQRLTDLLTPRLKRLPVGAARSVPATQVLAAQAVGAAGQRVTRHPAPPERRARRRGRPASVAGDVGVDRLAAVACAAKAAEAQALSRRRALVTGSAADPAQPVEVLAARLCHLAQEAVQIAAGSHAASARSGAGSASTSSRLCAR